MVLLLVIAVATPHRRRRTAADGPLAGLGRGRGGVVVWWHTARAIGAPAMIAVDDFRFAPTGLLLGPGLTVWCRSITSSASAYSSRVFRAAAVATLGMMFMIGAMT